MISKISLANEKEYNELGQELNENFSKIFDLNNELSKNYSHIYVYQIDNKLSGFIHIQQSFDEDDIINIITCKQYRNQHIATKLIDYCIEKHNLKALNLEVNINNPAVNFYLKNGFKIIRKIPKYYNNNDAYFMKRVIKWKMF